MVVRLKLGTQLPHIMLGRISEATTEANVAAVAAHRADIAFTTGDWMLDGCESLPLWTERLVLAVPTSRAAEFPDIVDWEGLQQETFIISADGASPEIKEHLRRRFSAFDEQPAISVHRVGRKNLLSMVAHGFGVVLTTVPATGAPYPDVEFRDFAEQAAKISSVAIWRRDNLNPALLRFVELAREHVTQAADRKTVTHNPAQRSARATSAGTV